MSTKFTLVSASLVALAVAVPALPAHAQDDRYGAQPEEITYESYEVVQDISDEPTSDDVYEEAYEYETYVDPAPDHHAMRTIPARSGNYPTIAPGTVVTGDAYGQPLGYSAQQRADWLADCRAIYLREYAEQDDDNNGGLLGGLLGAVIGGLAGNRIAGSGERLAGTAIGAGLGGLAGAVIGSAIDSADDDGDARDYAIDQADDYCAAYLARYEHGGVGGYVAGAYPVMMVPVQTTRRYAPREIVHEEWVEVDAAPRPARRSIPRRPAPQPDKRTPIR
tara:strand:+ start:38888 stop:39721 length:834 start_codon:yes stop_codon:yes gene_type:complete